MNAPWKVVLAFIGVFIAGTIFGGGFALRISQKVAPREAPRRLINPLPRQDGVAQPPLGTQLLRRFAENLDLTNEQRDKLRPLVAQAETQIAQIRQRSLEETERILRKLQDDFRAELRSDQLRKLNRLQQRQREVMQEEQQRRKQPPQYGPANRPNQNLSPPFDPSQRPNRPPGSNQPPYGQPNQFQGPPPGNGPPPPHFRPPPNEPAPQPPPGPTAEPVPEAQAPRA